MNNRNIISNKVDLFWTTSFSYIRFLPLVQKSLSHLSPPHTPMVFRQECPSFVREPVCQIILLKHIGVYKESGAYIMKLFLP
jgi:hypothetical protein